MASAASASPPRDEIWRAKPPGIQMRHARKAHELVRDSCFLTQVPSSSDVRTLEAGTCQECPFSSKADDLTRCLAGCGPGAGQCQPWTSASRALTVSQSADKCRDARGRKRRSAGPGLGRSAALYRAWPEPQRQHLTVVADLAN